MRVFLIVYIASYALLNLYVFRWLRPAFKWNVPASWSFAAFVLLMTFLPVLSRYCEKRDYCIAAQLSAIAAYSWALIVMWIVSFGLLAEFWNLIVSLFALRSQQAGSMRLSPRGFLAAIMVLAASLTLWGFIENRTPILRTVTMKTAKLPPGAPPLRLLHVSDAHFSVIVNQRRCDQLVRMIQEARPDLLLCTGDLFDSSDEERMSELAMRFIEVQPPLGKFAVLGNHEFYTGLDGNLYLYKLADFRLLRAENAAVTNGQVEIVIAGVDDPAGHGMNVAVRNDENAALPAAGAARPFTVLLKHQPEVDENSIGRFDLQLSGHTHWGQVFPFQIYVRLVYPYFRGMYELRDGSQIYVCSGFGTWGPPIRVLARPSATLFIVQPVDPSARRAAIH